MTVTLALWTADGTGGWNRRSLVPGGLDGRGLMRVRMDKKSGKIVGGGDRRWVS